jgi:DNA-binding NarL/FixJ family response regulator
MKGKTRYHRPAEPGTPLSDRELQVMRLVAEGLNNAQIGTRMYLAEDTIKRHLSRIFQRLEASTRAHAVALAYQRGLLHLDRPAEETHE